MVNNVSLICCWFHLLINLFSHGLTPPIQSQFLLLLLIMFIANPRLILLFRCTSPSSSRLLYQYSIASYSIPYSNPFWLCFGFLTRGLSSFVVWVGTSQLIAFHPLSLLFSYINPLFYIGYRIFYRSIVVCFPLESTDLLRGVCLSSHSYWVGIVSQCSLSSTVWHSLSSPPLPLLSSSSSVLFVPLQDSSQTTHSSLPSSPSFIHG